MSDNESSKKGWTDKERLIVLFALVEYSGVKFDYNAIPRPNGRSVVACQRMVERLKGTLKDDLEALKAGAAIDFGGAAPKKVATPRKRKGKDNGTNGEAQPSPTKRGRKKKVTTPEVVVDEEDEFAVKHEIKDEEDMHDDMGFDAEA